MKDENKTKQQLVSELGCLREQMAELKLAREKFQANGARARTLLETVPLGATECDVDGVIRFANRAYQEMLGYSEQELIGKPICDLLEPGPERDAFPAYLEHLVSEQPTPAPFLCRDVTKDGRTIDVQVDWTYQRDKEGRITGFVSILTDVSRRKQAEEALKELNEELEQKVSERTSQLERSNRQLEVFRLFAQSSTQGFGMADLEGRITYVNPALARMMGLNSPADAVGKHVMDFYPPEYSRRRREEILPAILRDGCWQGEVIVRANDRCMTYLQNSFLMRDEGGNPTRLASVITDITDRRQAEDALRQSHDELRGIQDGMVDGLLIADIETKRFVRANAAMCRLLGYSEQQLLSMSVPDIHPQEDLPRILEEFRSLAEGTLPVCMRCPTLRKDHALLYFDIAASRVVYNGRPCVIGFFHDVTERELATKSLRESEAKYRSLVDTSPDGVLMVDLHGRVMFASERAREMYGSERAEDLHGMSPFEVIVPEHHDRFRENLRKTIETGITRNVEYGILKKDGARMDGELSAALIDDGAGKPLAMVVIVRDISARKQAQRALEQERRTLVQMLRAGDHERQTISYDIHDDLAQPLTAAIMQFQSYDSLKERHPRGAKTAYDAGMQMLQRAHFEARRLISGVRPPILDESGIAAAITHLVYEQSAEDGPKIEFRSNVQAERLAPILENAVYRIAQESLGNACRHSGGKKVKVVLNQVGDALHLEVQDWGAGFDPDAVSEDRFGLEGIRQRVRLLDGECFIQSKPGRGTRIRVRLPIIEQG